MRVPERLIQHACVGLAALMLPLLVPRAIQAAEPPGAVALPPILDAGVPVSAAIERHMGPLFTERPAQVIKVAPGDTLDGLASQFHIDAATLRWANAVPDVSQPAVGARLVVPPAQGVLVRIRHRAAPSAIAAELNVDPRVILDYNALDDDQPLAQGTYLQVPREVGPRDALDNTIVVPLSRGVPGIPSTQLLSGPVASAFPWGQCTYWVSTHRRVTWAGNGGQWFEAGRATGRPVGHVPVAGAIAVMYGGWYGHVAFVERVNGDGTFLISEMNVKGVGVIDERVLEPSSPLLIGFVY